MRQKQDSLYKQFISKPPLVAAFGAGVLILGAIVLSTNHIFAFFSLASLMIVVGGVFSVAFMSYHKDDVIAALQAIREMYRESHATHHNLHEDMIDILDWARIVKKFGMRGLEDKMGEDKIDDPFVTYGLNMVISNYTPDEVRAMMETAADACYERDNVPVQVLQSMASHAPAFGMIGTLVGMVTLMSNIGGLGGDMASMGSGLAVAFLSTLYGVLSARIVYMPAAARLIQKIDGRRFRNYLITEGMVMLVDNKKPMFIQDRLNSFLRPEIHDLLNKAPYRPQAPRLEAVKTL